MNRMTKFVAPIVVLALSFSYIARAEDPATGTVNVTVLDNEAKAVAGVTVRITPPRAPRGGGGGGGGGGAAAPGGGAGGGGGAGRGQAPALATGTTDKDGKVTLEKVPVGEFQIVVMLTGKGNAREPITIKANETTTAKLTLMPRAPRGGGGGGNRGPATQPGAGQ